MTMKTAVSTRLRFRRCGIGCKVCEIRVPVPVPVPEKKINDTTYQMFRFFAFVIGLVAAACRQLAGLTKRASSNLQGEPVQPLAITGEKACRIDFHFD